MKRMIKWLLVYITFLVLFLVMNKSDIFLVESIPRIIAAYMLAELLVPREVNDHA